MNKQKKTNLPIIGWREWVGLPALGVAGIKAKIDTGARTSAVHAYHVEPFSHEGELWVAFLLHPVQHHRHPEIHCEAPVHDFREITSSNGAREPRYVIQTTARIGTFESPIQITLTNRDEMGFRMLLGREAIRGRFLVDPRRSFLIGKGPVS